MKYPGWVEWDLALDVDGRAITGNPVSGDVAYMGLRVDREAQERVTEILWRVEGGDDAIAAFAVWVQIPTSSVVTMETLMSWTPEFLQQQVADIRPDIVLHLLQTVHKACNNYFARTGQKERITQEERNVLCACQDISDFEIRQVYLRGNQHLDAIKEATGVCSECDLCEERVAHYVEELQREFPMNTHAHIRH